MLMRGEQQLRIQLVKLDSSEAQPYSLSMCDRPNVCHDIKITIITIPTFQNGTNCHEHGVFCLSI